MPWGKSAMNLSKDFKSFESTFIEFTFLCWAHWWWRRGSSRSNHAFLSSSPSFFPPLCFLSCLLFSLSSFLPSFRLFFLSLFLFFLFFLSFLSFPSLPFLSFLPSVLSFFISFFLLFFISLCVHFSFNVLLPFFHFYRYSIIYDALFLCLFTFFSFSFLPFTFPCSFVFLSPAWDGINLHCLGRQEAVQECIAVSANGSKILFGENLWLTLCQKQWERFVSLIGCASLYPYTVLHRS